MAFDAGVVADGYAGEVGRTWPVGLDASAPAVDDLYRARTSCGSGCSTPADPGAPASGLLDAYRAAGEPLPVDAGRRAASASASTTR